MEQVDEATYNLLNCEIIGETSVNENDHSVSQCELVREDRLVHHEPDDMLKFIKSNQNANTFKKTLFVCMAKVKEFMWSKNEFIHLHEINPSKLDPYLAFYSQC
ncbi:hypothetical protein ACJMK2_026028 [Sinanodonta woodiana]|uniref:Uncharacterized protein n=1 Tax=Sinanodonta woodiana TaxID=1069815 RepID=A0ABD3XIU6_SINWO